MFLAEIVGIAAVLAGGEKLNLFLNFTKFTQILLEYFPKLFFLHSGLIDDIVDIGQDITFDIFYLLVDAIEADFIFLQLFANWFVVHFQGEQGSLVGYYQLLAESVVVAV